MGFCPHLTLLWLMLLLRFLSRFDEYNVFLADRNDGQMYENKTPIVTNQSFFINKCIKLND